MLRINAINRDPSKMVQHIEGQMIRVAYLYADKTMVSGTTYVTIDFEEQYARSNSNEKLKVHVCRSLCEKLNPPMPVTEFDEMLKALKQARTVKHKSKEAIVFIKQTEKFVDVLYGDCINFFRMIVAQSGLQELIKLEEEEMELACSSGNRPEYDQDNHIPYSVILKKKWVETDEVYIFANLWEEFCAENGLVMEFSEKVTPKADVVMFPLASTTVLNFFSAAELKLIKQDLSKEIKPFKEAMEKWSATLKEADFSASAFGSYQQYFSTEMAPYVQALVEKMDANEALEKVKVFYRGKAGCENYIGIAKAKTVWDYMEWSGIVPKESMHVFRENMPDGCNENRAVAFLLCNVYNEVNKGEEVADKKYLEL